VSGGQPQPLPPLVSLFDASDGAEVPLPPELGAI
jgi:hypothetical protein